MAKLLLRSIARFRKVYKHLKYRERFTPQKIRQTVDRTTDYDKAGLQRASNKPPTSLKVQVKNR